MRSSHFRRREFLGTAATAAAVTGGLPAALAGSVERAGIPVRVLGKTGLRLPVLAYGGAALPSAWGNTLSMDQRIKLVRYAYERGIRYFDTAGNYKESQSILGEALRDVRDHVCLVGKVETTDPGKVRGQVERALRELQTDHLDAILIHGTPGIQQMSVKQAFEIHSELLKLKREKLTSFVGLSAHGYFDKALALIESGGFDLCMLSYGYLPRGHDQIFSTRMQELRESCMARAHELKMGIAAMKVVGAGLLGARAPHVVPGYDKAKIGRLPGAAIRWTMKDKRIDLLVIGMRNRTEVEANIGSVLRDTDCTPDDEELLQAYCARAYESDVIKKLKVE